MKNKICEAEQEYLRQKDRYMRDQIPWKHNYYGIPFVFELHGELFGIILLTIRKKMQNTKQPQMNYVQQISFSMALFRKDCF